MHESFGSFVAEVVDVTVSEDGEFSVDRVVCAVDCGIAINPDVIRAQMEGGIGYALSAALREEVTLSAGEVEQRNFDRYRPLLIDEMPDIEVHIVPSAEPPTGVGEPGTPPLAPALVNALAERLSQRIADSVMQLVGRASSPRDALRNFAAGYLTRAAEDRNLYLFVTAGGTGEDRVHQSLLLADRAVAQFSGGIAASREAMGEDPGVAKVWSYGLLGALHFVTLWWLRDQDAQFDEVVDQIVELLWSGMRVDEEP